VQLGGRGTDAGYQLQVRAPALAGDVLLATDAPIRVALDKLLHESSPTAEAETAVAPVPTERFPAEAAVPQSASIAAQPTEAPTAEPAQDTETAEKAIVLREPADWPELEIDCKQCRFYSRDFGKLQLSLRNEQQNKRLSIKAERKDLLDLTLNGVWSAADHDTAIRGRVSSRDWGKLTQDWGVDLGVRDSSGHIDLDLRWQPVVAKSRCSSARAISLVTRKPRNGWRVCSVCLACRR
jgi:uncharacterized protein YhdP